MPPKPIVTIEIKDQYGKPVAYPVDMNAQVFATIAGTKTLTEPTLQRIVALGFELIVVNQEWKLK